MRRGAQGWCTGMTLRDGMRREVGERGYILQTRKELLRQSLIVKCSVTVEFLEMGRLFYCS